FPITKYSSINYSNLYFEYKFITNIMADIAMLVAEEYERRIKNSRKFGNEEKIELFSTFSILVQELKWSSSKIKMRFGENEKRVFVPQTEIGLAAINGLFSA
ncbi:hypothetical protein AABB24_009830, partial [Solanum stoloniferum]